MDQVRAERGTVAADDRPYVVGLNRVCNGPSYHVKQENEGWRMEDQIDVSPYHRLEGVVHIQEISLL